MTWHIEPTQARRYADGSLPGARAESVEAHLLGCAGCRGLIASAAPAPRLALLWEAVQERVDAPRPLRLQRLLERLGMRPDEARLAAAAPTLHGPWVLAVAVVLGFVAAAAGSTHQATLLYLVAAPLVPLLGVAGAYAPGLDPTYDLTRATPYPAERLLLLRALLVLAASLPLTMTWAAVAADGWEAVVWLLPALAMVGLTLVLSGRLGLHVAGLVVASGYLLVVTTTWASTGAFDGLFAAPAQLGSLAVLTACAVVLLTPSRRLSYRRLT